MEEEKDYTRLGLILALAPFDKMEKEKKRTQLAQNRRITSDWLMNETLSLIGSFTVENDRRIEEKMAERERQKDCSEHVMVRMKS